MEYLRKIRKLLKSLNQLLETIIMSNLQSSLKRLTAKYQVKEYFRKIAPPFLSSPIFVCNIFASLFFLTKHYILGGIFFSFSLLMLIWWNSKKWKMQQKMFQEAKERYRRMEELFESSPININLFYTTFPDWSYALVDGFSMQALALYAKYLQQFERKNDYSRTSSRNYQTTSLEKVKAMQVFGISTLVGMTEDKLKKIYRTLAKKCHPDIHPNDASCEVKFKELSNAYNTLLKCI